MEQTWNKTLKHLILKKNILKDTSSNGVFSCSLAQTSFCSQLAQHFLCDAAEDLPFSSLFVRENISSLLRDIFLHTTRQCAIICLWQHNLSFLKPDNFWRCDSKGRLVPGVRGNRDNGGNTMFNNVLRIVLLWEYVQCGVFSKGGFSFPHYEDWSTKALLLWVSGLICRNKYNKIIKTGCLF